MISLIDQHLKTITTRGNHSWNVLEEMLACSVSDNNLLDDKDKLNVLIKVYEEARLRIKVSSASMKIQNYQTLDKKSTLNNANKLSISIHSHKTNLEFQRILKDVLYNKWVYYDKNNGKPDLFINHDLELFFSRDYLASPISKVINLNLVYFKEKINSYLDNIFEHVTPQHYIEHANAIGLLDKIIIISEEDQKSLRINNMDEFHRINDYMGLFCPSCKGIKKDLKILGVKNIKENSVVIILCPELMESCRHMLITNKVSLIEMVDKVFSHEIGHLAFYYYYSILGWNDNKLTIAEKQANWICSISHDGSIDSLIKEITTIQPPKYHNPILLSDKKSLDYEYKVDMLYMR